MADGHGRFRIAIVEYGTKPADQFEANPVTL